jgi:hypothetical protein
MIIAPVTSFEIRTIVLVVEVVTIVSIPCGIVIISGIGISVTISYRSRCRYIASCEYYGSRVIEPGGVDPESDTSVYIYLRVTGIGYQARCDDHRGDY